MQNPSANISFRIQHAFVVLLLFVLKERTVCPLQLLRKKKKEKQTQEQGVDSEWTNEECNGDVERKRLCDKVWLPRSLGSSLIKRRRVRHEEPSLPVHAGWGGSAFWVDHAGEDEGNLWHTMAKWFINVHIIKPMMLGQILRVMLPHSDTRSLERQLHLLMSPLIRERVVFCLEREYNKCVQH